MRRAFTLVELLVTIGVISLLAGILLPAFGAMRARADSSQCMANLRSLGVALNAYLADHDMRLPQMEAARADKSEEVPVIDNTLDRYVNNKRVFVCPSGRHLAEKTGTSYYWNSALAQDPNQSMAGLQFLWITEPAKIPLILDKEGWHKHTDDKVNHLFADGHVANQLLFTVE